MFLTRNFPFIVGTFTCKCSRVSSDSFENIGIDGKVIPPPPTFALNKNNINLAQKVILEEYRTSDGAENPYAALRDCNGNFVH